MLCANHQVYDNLLIDANPKDRLGIILSRVEDVDKAFELLLVIIGLVLSIFSSHSEALVNLSTMDPELLSSILVRFTVIPLLVILSIWMIAKLTKNQYLQISSKLVAWMTAINTTIGVLYIYFRELGYFPDVRIAGVEIVSYIGFFLIPIFVYFVLIPRYRDMYPDASFFKSQTGFVVTYISFIIVQLIAINYLMFGTFIP